MAVDLAGKIALVTVGGRGTGAGAVRLLVAAGARVVIANRTTGVAEELVAELGPNTAVRQIPGFTRAELKAFVDDAAAAFGGLDILIHDTGGCPWMNIEQLDEQELEAALDLTLKACVWLTQSVIPHMRKQGGGRITFSSSVPADVPFRGAAHYSAAKAAVNAFLRGAAFELAPDGITVNGIEPGPDAKSRTEAPKGMVRMIGSYVPSDRMHGGDDIADTILYLASEEAKYMTGQIHVPLRCYTAMQEDEALEASRHDER